MPKFSIIIPVYNVEKYIKKCVDSVFNQTFKDYEVIVVNDGTPDKSMEMIKEYDVTIIDQKNQGLSAARNNAVKKAKGDYIIFLDSDDYWRKDLLKEINKSLKNNPDVVRFQIQEIFEDQDGILEHKEKGFEGLNGVDAFNTICNYHYLENAWCYAIKRKYFEKNKFEFKKGKIHEDFGLLPLVIIKADIVNSIEYIGYNYLQRKTSIMGNKSYEKTIKKVSDMFEHYKFLTTEIDKTKIDSKIFKSFVSNSTILKICELKGKEYKEFKKKLKEEHVYDNLLTDTLPRKIKKQILKISPKLFYKITK